MTQRNSVPEYNKNVFMALKYCPFPHRYIKAEKCTEIRNESIYESNRKSFKEIIINCFEPLDKYGLGIELKFY